LTGMTTLGVVTTPHTLTVSRPAVSHLDFLVFTGCVSVNSQSP
jgi:hypothetical protein